MFHPARGFTPSLESGVRGDFSRKRVHGIMMQFSDSEKAREAVTQAVETLPEEHHDQLCQWADELKSAFDDIVSSLNHDLEMTQDFEDRQLGRAMSGRGDPNVNFHLQPSLRKILFVHRNKGREVALKALWKVVV